MSHAFEEELRNSLVKEVVPKKQVILKEGQTAHRIHFVEQGCLRGYFSEKERKLTRGL